MSVISSGTTLTTALVQTGDTNGNLVFKTGASGTTALTLGSDQSATFAGAVSFSGGAFAAGSAGAPSITFTGDTNTGIFSPAADTIAFSEGGTESMRIDSLGQLGIGTSSPGYRLDVAAGDTTAGLGYAARLRSNSTASAATLQFTNNAVTNQNAYITADDSQNLTLASGTGYARLWTNGSERMRIDSSGNVGIGTSSPSEKLSVTGNIALTGGISMQNNQGPYWGGGTAYISYNTSSNYLSFGTNSVADRMRIDSSGNLLVGNGTNGVALEPNGQAYKSRIININSSNVYIDNSSTCGYVFSYNNASNFAGITAASFNIGSDYRLKENIVPLTDALAQVKKFKPIKYSFKTDNKMSMPWGTELVDGFLAHEFAEVVPTAVTGEKDAVDENGEIVIQTLDMTKAVPLLVAAIQEQQAIITDQASTIAAFEARLTALENK